MVLDSGDGVTHAVPIYEGFAMPHSIMRVDIAGRDVSRYLRLLLRKEGFDFHTSAEFEVVRTIKEVTRAEGQGNDLEREWRVAGPRRDFKPWGWVSRSWPSEGVSLPPTAGLLPVHQPTEGRGSGDREGAVYFARWQHTRRKSQAWPWVAVVPPGPRGKGSPSTSIFCVPKVGPARFRAPELLFQPDLVGEESEGLHEVLAFAIHKSDLDLRRMLFANIVLSGGSTLFKGTLD